MPPTASYPLYWIPLLPLLGALVNLTLGRRLSRRWVYFFACASVGAAGVIAIAAITGPLWQLYGAHRSSGATPALTSDVYTWIASGNLNVQLRFLMDPLAAVMVFTVTFVGFLIHVYSTGYMAHDRRYATYFGYLNLFTGAMLILVLGDSLPVLFIGWEGVGLCSYLLIGFWFDKEKNADAGRKAFVVNRIGDFAFLVGIFLLFWEVGALDYAGLEASKAKLASDLGGMPVAFWAGLLLFIGACGKSAQIPLYVWLPDAMAGPTPVSALIHAATMVTAGVYMVARLNFVYMAAPEVMMIVAGVGTATALYAAIIGFAQTDIKKVLAYSTVSQLGFMFVGVGTGAFNAGIFHLFTHAFFKAGLFLGAGSVMHAMGDRGNILEMGGLRKKTPITHATFLIYCLAIAGIVPFAGFFSKDEILLGAFTAHLAGWPAWYGKLLWIALSIAALGTAFYMWRLYFLVFWGESRADEKTKQHIHESPASMTVPLVVLAAGAVGLGFLGLPHVVGPNWIGEWLAPSLRAQPVHHAGAGITWLLMGVALVSGVVGIGLAAAIYSRGPEKAGRLVAALGPIHKLVANKFYVDELYDLVIVRPFRYAATALFTVIDRLLIDTVLVNGSAFVIATVGRMARAWQNGDVQRYLLAIVVGAAAIVYFATRSSPGFSYRVEGTEATFRADLGGAGPTAEGAKIEWDFDGDGKPEAAYADRREATWDFRSPGKYPVTLWVTDGVFGERREVKREVEVR